MNAQTQLRMMILAVLERQPEHGYAIAQAIKARSAGVLLAREGMLYPVLHALEAGGQVQSSEVEVSGRVRREYRLTDNGAAALQKLRGDWKRQQGAVNAVLSGKA
ncbi:helix-turn-helix transcriptional regulator [Deinococcus radiomollis]|uniref:PadR family transcriptional regulator n=1 Tax=Deinococcus radiomollis TaxID=468916 RepID=UPI003891F0A0